MDDFFFLPVQKFDELNEEGQLSILASEEGLGQDLHNFLRLKNGLVGQYHFIVKEGEGDYITGQCVEVWGEFYLDLDGHSDVIILQPVSAIYNESGSVGIMGSIADALQESGRFDEVFNDNDAGAIMVYEDGDVHILRVAQLLPPIEC